MRKIKVRITSHGILRVAKFNGLRTPAVLYLTPLEIEILRAQGVQIEEVKEELETKKKQSKKKNSDQE